MIEQKEAMEACDKLLKAKEIRRPPIPKVAGVLFGSTGPALLQLFTSSPHARTTAPGFLAFPRLQYTGAEKASRRRHCQDQQCPRCSGASTRRMRHRRSARVSDVTEHATARLRLQVRVAASQSGDLAWRASSGTIPPSSPNFNESFDGRGLLRKVERGKERGSPFGNVIRTHRKRLEDEECGLPCLFSERGQRVQRSDTVDGRKSGSSRVDDKDGLIPSTALDVLPMSYFSSFQ
ncbi:uncharacterized protein LOC132004954 [Mustela nigripes]|uniref:uncharacterized protein LOC132004954 n=1 Tax=Mustela nigripes TaxID=77151 RepID=UPI002815152F|nr:uncharacterized protein LOC132004954 [Mustela nigripes]